MTIVLDAGAFIAAERDDPRVTSIVRAHQADGGDLITHGGVVGQVWRGGGRQVRMGRLLAGTEIVPLDETLGRRVGALLARAKSSDVIDAALIILSRDGDQVLTSDPQDLSLLAAEFGLHLEITPV